MEILIFPENISCIGLTNSGHDWKKFDLIMINNKRFLHGRRKIDNLSKRQIVNLQSLEINI